MKAKELHKKTPKELEKILREDQAKLQQMRFDLVAGKVKNVRDIRATRKTIARIHTLLHEQNNKVLGEAK